MYFTGAGRRRVGRAVERRALHRPQDAGGETARWITILNKKITNIDNRGSTIGGGETETARIVT